MHFTHITNLGTFSDPLVWILKLLELGYAPKTNACQDFLCGLIDFE